ncbi:microneme protein [Cystoisospora suis]|uniref:Microneme protein n=1 Tax=Cystoisospora suis TaxID=483139 RepID=A0A2C6L1G2_9APIC|nr:microneme protein [Cystoisospora suis]
MQELVQFMEKQKWEYCSPFQQSADALCKFKKKGHIARYDEKSQAWMCYDIRDLLYEQSGNCFDNCGARTKCVGGPHEGEQRGIPVDEKDKLDEALAAIQPCDAEHLCIPSTKNPPLCERKHQAIAVQQLSKQQAEMDHMCQKEVDQRCRLGTFATDCFKLWLARKDVGAAEDESELHWRCYSEEALDFRKVSTCTDGCSKEIPCRGAPESSSEGVLELPGLADVAGDETFCPPAQKAGNDYCGKKHGSMEWVARQSVETYKWS